MRSSTVPYDFGKGSKDPYLLALISWLHTICQISHCAGSLSGTSPFHVDLGARIFPAGTALQLSSFIAYLGTVYLSLFITLSPFFGL